jgi:nicotinate phosphoribosyltransferase
VPDLPTLAESREFLRHNLISIPWEGLKLSQGEPAIPVSVLPTRSTERESA